MTVDILLVKGVSQWPIALSKRLEYSVAARSINETLVTFLSHGESKVVLREEKSYISVVRGALFETGA
jgi:hypothetical protein